MALDPATVRNVAHLARLDLTDAEVNRLGDELETIIGYVEQLQQVDVSSVDGIANVAGLEDITRADQVAPMLPADAVLKHAPKANDVAFLVPKAVER